MGLHPVDKSDGVSVKCAGGLAGVSSLEHACQKTPERGHGNESPAPCGASAGGGRAAAGIEQWDGRVVA